MSGKVRATLRLLMGNDSNGPFSLDNIFDNKSVRVILLGKRPNGKPMDSSAVALPEFPTREPHPVIFDQITGSLIRSVALEMEGAAGPQMYILMLGDEYVLLYIVPPPLIYMKR